MFIIPSTIKGVYLEFASMIFAEVDLFEYINYSITPGSAGQYENK